MLTADLLDLRAEAIAGSATLTALKDRALERAARLLDESPAFPERKATLTRDGGVCPVDGAPLRFDPWSRDRHRCRRCGAEHQGPRHDGRWARFQHLWLAERAAHLATLAVFGAPRATARATEILAWYAARYASFPNQDNVLGPSRLFFSTYLESIWLSHMMVAAWLLRERGLLGDGLAESVSGMADEAANVVGEFDEGLSNRQTWHNAALAAVAVWFEDEGLAHRVIEGPTGLIAHLLHGFGPDGLWYEGENYHFFAWQGLLYGTGWTRLAGVDVFQEPELAPRLGEILRAPIATALPNATFPARKDSRFGVSLAQPMYLEAWEISLARLTEAGHEMPGIAGWLGHLYAQEPPAALAADSYLDEADWVSERRGRSDLSWRTLLEMLPELPDEAHEIPESGLLESQGLAILRQADRYAGLECGVYGGGHGHPDRLHLTVFADDVHWLPDPGTGSYVAEDLHWYRSTMAHNAPLEDGRSQALGDAWCEAFDGAGDWDWVRGTFGEATRTLVQAPDHLLDVVESNRDETHSLDLPWHFQGDWAIRSPGEWRTASLALPHVTSAERWHPTGDGPVLVAAHHGSGTLSAALAFDGTLWRLTGPGLPEAAAPASFLLVRMHGAHPRCATVLAPGVSVDALRLAVDGDRFSVGIGDATTVHQVVTGGWQIQAGEARVRLEGVRPPRTASRPLVHQGRPLGVGATVPWAAALPVPNDLAGPAEGVELHLDHEDQYRRSEQPYAGSDALSASARVLWGEGGLLVDVAVRKEEIVPRDPDAPPLGLDNESDDIHGDGIQVYLSLDGQPFGALLALTPSAPRLAIRAITGEGRVAGAWETTAEGYRVRMLVTPAWWEGVVQGTDLGFDLLVNEARRGRVRRAGQLVWSGGGGWVWLRGDRQSPEQFGTLRLG